MPIYVECPSCHRKQSLKNESCRTCGFDLLSARRINKAGHWVYLRFRGRQVWERIGPSLTVAREQEVLIRTRTSTRLTGFGGRRARISRCSRATLSPNWLLYFEIIMCQILWAHQAKNQNVGVFRGPTRGR